MSLISKIVSKFSGLSQEETARAAAEKTITPGMPEILRRAAAEGAVLLKNDGLLPLENNETVALFGRVQSEWFYTGYGSGGDVNKPYAVNLIEGVRNCSALQLYEPLAKLYSDWSEKNPIDHGFWGHWPRFYPEMPLSKDVAADAAAKADCAVVTIGRSSGEDRENALEKGSFYLTDDERTLLETVTEAFEKTVVQQDRAILRHAYREGEYIGFPHAFTFETEYVLKENGIRQNVRIKNDSPRIMPCMLAFHTTFRIPFSYSPEAETVSVKVPVEREFIRDQNFLPTGQTKTDTAVMRLLNGEGFIPEKQYLSAFYSSAGNTAVLFDKQIGLRVEYRAVSEQYKYWMLWNGERKDLFCIEPQTCMIDAFHHQEDGRIPGVFGILPGKTAELCTELSCFAL